MKQHGLTLLETVLVISVISLILILSVRYFSVVQFNQKISQSISQLKTLSKASYQWLETARQSDFGSSGTAIDMTQLRNVGLITAEDERDPWGGSITVGPGTDASFVKITLEEVPKRACLNLRRRLSDIAHAQSSEDECKNGTRYFIEL